LGNPEYDPHGDPIPDAEGNLKSRNKKVLSHIPENEVVICVGVKESGSDFLRYLDKRNINIGTEIQVLRKEFVGSMDRLVYCKPFSVSERVAGNMYVQPI